jgi:hemerythrin-like metal-binding protein
MLSQWNDSFNIGIPAIDRLHRELYGLLDDLRQAITTGSEVLIAAKVMNRLLPFVEEHFEEEKKTLLVDSLEYQHCCARHAEEMAMVNFFLRDKTPEYPGAAKDLLYFVDSMLDGHLESDRRALESGDENLIQ